MLSPEILNNNLNNSVPLSRFFSAFGYSQDETIYIQYYDDTKPIKDKHGKKEQFKVKSFNDDVIAGMKTMNEGSGYTDGRKYYVGFRVNGGGTKKEDPTIARAQFMEIDTDEKGAIVPFDKQIEMLNRFGLDPSIIIKTRKSLHCYWLLNDGDIELFVPIQEQLIQYFNSDPGLSQKNRAMRLYGFYHQKKDPVMVTLIKFDPELRYSQQQLSDVLPELEPKKKKRKSRAAVSLSAGDKVKPGYRHEHMVHQIGKLVNAMKYIDRDAIVFAAYAIYQKECEILQDETFEDFENEYGKMIDSFIMNDEAEKTSINISLDPSDRTDIGQADMFVKLYGEYVKFSKETGFLVYDGKVWNIEGEKGVKALGISQRLTDLQLSQAWERIEQAQDKLNEYTKAVDNGEPPDKARFDALKKEMSAAESFRDFINKRRTRTRVEATISMVKPKVEIDPKILDADPFLLNTPAGVVDLRTGESREHKPNDYCTKITKLSPGSESADLFLAFLDRVTVGDKDLERYLQDVAGMCAIGKVFHENLIIAYGEGGNGKSTLFNLIANVLGDYADSISPDLLITTPKNKGAELAELRGKRLVIAAELEEGMRLSTASLKRVTSTDQIRGEAKFLQPYSFDPTHTTILYTNYLPKVGSMDSGTWSRIVVVPFLAKFRNEKGEIKNYADYLFQNCGGAVLNWIIAGAKRYIENEYQIMLPDCVKTAIEAYRVENDWISHFIEECCETDSSYWVQSGELYKRYQSYCEESGEYKRSGADFKKALMQAGYEHKATKKGKVFYGLRLLIAQRYPYHGGSYTG